MTASALSPRTDETTDVRLVAARPLVAAPVDATFRLGPGDRPLVGAGDSVVVGAPLAERLRDPRLDEASGGPGPDAVPGDRWTPADRDDGVDVGTGELLFRWRGRWRVVGGAVSDPLEAPFAGIVREVRPGTSITIRAAGRGLRGIVALGGATRGRLQGSVNGELRPGELRPGGLDVGAAGSILVVGARVDAETLTRARAMGVRGIVVMGLSSKERRDYLASEARQRSSIHRRPPFAVLVLDGALRRPLSGAVRSLLGALSGQEVAIVTDPPMLVFDLPTLAVPLPPADVVRVRNGPWAGREGRFLEAVGPRQFPGGVLLEAGRVQFPDGSLATVPLGELERFV